MRQSPKQVLQVETTDPAPQWNQSVSTVRATKWTPACESLRPNNRQQTS